MATKTLKQLQDQRKQEIEQNRSLGIIEWRNGEEQSDQVWEVEEGKVHLSDGRGKRTVIGPGNRFRPTVEQIERTRSGKGGLLGKARELTQTEYAGIRSGRITSRGADIGLRQFKMAESTLKYAIENGLTEEDFRSIDPDGSDGRYTLIQVEAMVEARQQAA